MHVRRSALDRLVAPDAFQWLAGIEDTFITAPSPKTGRTLDEYELTEHYTRWEADLQLFAELGLRAVRYGIPWHRINPARGVWDFRWADEPLERLLELGIAPVVDLVHYGLPAWIEGAYLNPDYPELVAEYAARVAERFHGRIHTYTPLNEPRVTAWYCGRIGWWPPFGRSWRGFVEVMLGVCRGIVRTVERMRAVDPEIVDVHVDATDLYDAASSVLAAENVSPALAAEAARRQEIVFLALDLVSGRVQPGHPLHAWLLQHGADTATLEWFVEHALEPDLIGINLYPMFSQKRLLQARGGLRVRMRYAKAEIVETLADLYWQRYHRPLLISETASVGSVRRRRAWLDSSVEAVARTRSRGVPLLGYTWWPLFALVTWGYREGKKPPADYLYQMGLWNLARDASGLARVPTPLVERYRELVAGGVREVGRLNAVGGTHDTGGYSAGPRASPAPATTTLSTTVGSGDVS
ncbi:MAG TPA: family 1 glycosylhydrolase [Steroidobacteraceae bacterium]|nr:family 1 glycosylhydrolase [Steroidobacteraceae bacterium]